MSSLSTCTERCLLLLLFILLPFQAAQAIGFKTLLMPGKVIEGHAQYEEECESCHDNFDKGKQKSYCLDCHDAINDDMQKREGFHGKSPAIQTRECKSCHTDHKGREAIIVHLDNQRFDHQLSDFELTGAHATTTCTLCHSRERKHRDTPSDCYSCHREDDRHQGNMGKACGDCHKTDKWAKNSFNHDKTQFILKGSHIEVSCNSCHPNQRYKDVPTTCNNCHRSNDIHAGNLGEKCDSCHNSEKWKNVRFDHTRDTKFSLKGAHAELQCQVCHSRPVTVEKKAGRLGKACYTCHHLDDVHSGRNGRDCASCHNNRRWGDSSFEHDKKTKFPLSGAHEQQACQACHRSDPKTEKLKSDCIACHAGEDIHREQLGKQCDNCHGTDSWGKKVAFDHDLSRFPLIGQHAIAPCEACHIDTTYKDTEQRCIVCHEDVDSHEGIMGENCASCHNPNDWRLWYFDHDRQSDFKLSGAHEDLSCAACHRDPVHQGKNTTARDCSDCHARDDIHHGDFGDDCAKCHLTSRFNAFKLNGITGR